MPQDAARSTWHVRPVRLGASAAARCRDPGRARPPPPGTQGERPHEDDDPDLGAGLALGLAGGASAQETCFPLIAKGFSHRVWQAVKAGAEPAAAAAGVTIIVEGPNTEAEIDRQADILNAAFDSGVDSDLPLTTFTTDTMAAAAAAADHLAEAIGGDGRIAAVIHDQTSATGIGRRDGVLNRIAEAYPTIEVVDVQSANDALKAADTVKAMLPATPDIEGLFAPNEGAAIGLSVAIRESGAQSVGVGSDPGRTRKDAITAGTLIGAITQNPVGIRECVVDSLVKAVAGEELPPVIDTGFHWSDATTMADPRIAVVLYD